MRISDWSSDVCSSDLAVDDLRHPCGRRVPLCQFGPHANQCGRRNAPSAKPLRHGHGPEVRLVKGRDHFWSGIALEIALSGILLKQRAERNGGIHHFLPRLSLECPSCSKSPEHTSELQPLMRTPYAVVCLQKRLPRLSTHLHKQTLH